MSQYTRTTLPGVPVELPVIVIDLDSTVYDTRHRRHLAPGREHYGTPNTAWKPFSLGCPEDTVIESMAVLTRLLHESCFIFLLTARNDVAEEATLNRLAEDRVPFDRLRMAGPEDEDTSNHDYKVQVLKEWIAEGWNITLFIDDWAETCRAVTEQVGVPSIAPVFLAGAYKPGH